MNDGGQLRLGFSSMCFTTEDVFRSYPTAAAMKLLDNRKHSLEGSNSDNYGIDFLPLLEREIKEKKWTNRNYDTSASLEYGLDTSSYSEDFSLFIFLMSLL